MKRNGNERGISEAIGTILLISLTVTAIGVIAALYLGNPAPDKIPKLSASVLVFGRDPSSKMLAISHDGGDFLPYSSLIVQYGSTRYTCGQYFSDIGDCTLQLACPDDNWQIGRTIQIPYNSSGQGWITLMRKVGSLEQVILTTNNFLQIPDEPCGDQFSPLQEAPQVMVISPDGTQIIPMGSYFPISWKVVSRNPLLGSTIQFSSNGGSTWSQIGSSGIYVGSPFRWTVPNIKSSNCLIRVRSTTIYGNQSDGVSNVFTIKDTNAPIVAVKTPNDGDIYNYKSKLTISWDASDNVGVTEIRLEYSTNGGVTWSNITSLSPPTSNEYIWTVPTLDQPTYSRCQIRVTAYDIERNAASKTNNGFFTLRDGIPPTVKLQQPNGGEKILKNTQYPIIYTVSDDFDPLEEVINLEYSLNNGISWTPIVNGLTGTSTYLWTPDTASSEGLIRVTAIDKAGNTAKVQSNLPFTINEDPPPVISLNRPVGGEIWRGDTNESIQWTATQSGIATITKINLAYSTDNSTFVNITDTGNTGTYNWLISFLPSPSVSAWVKVTAYNSQGDVTSARNYNPFTILSEVPPNIHLNVPIGDELWEAGSNQLIQWNVSQARGGIISNINILYTSDNGLTWNSLANNLSGSTTQYSWTVPNILSNQYKVNITAINNWNLSDSDESSTTFSIVDTTPPTVTVANPSTGVIWPCGSNRTIQWTASDSIGGVSGIKSLNISSSNDNGINWLQIVSNIANNGTYLWSVPNFPSTNYIVRVEAIDASGNLGNGISGKFSIADQTPPTIQIISPNGGESYQVGYNPLTNPVIQWTASDNIGVQKVDISYSINSGSSWIPISSGTANTGSYYWSIPNTPSTNCYIKIKAYDSYGNTAVDQSNAKFTIHS